MAERVRKTIMPAVLLTIAALVFSISVTSGQDPEPRPEKLDATLLGMVQAGANEASDYLTLSDDTEQGYRPSAVLPGRPLRSNLFGSTYSEEDSSVRALVKTNGSLAGLDDLGVVVQSVVGSVVAARIPLGSLLQLTSLSNVEYVEASHKLSLSNDISVPTTGAPGFHDAGIDGSGVIVAVIDTGVDFTHDDFRNLDGTTRIKFICDQTDPPLGGDNTCPGDGTSNGGTLWTESQINATLGGSSVVRQVDDNGHGTHVLGSAAGDDESFGGMAPGADIIVVKSTLFTDDEISAMSFIDEKATELGMPYVINMSFGGHFGPHDGTDLLSLAIDELTGSGKPGKVVVAAAGNDGDEVIHAGGNVSPGTQTVGFTITPDLFDIILDIWYDGSDSFSFGFIDPDGEGLSGFVPGESGSFCNGDSITSTCVIIDHTTTQSNNSSKEIIFAVVPFSGDSISLTGTWSITLTGDVVSGGGFDAWIADCFPFRDCQFISSHGNTDSTVTQPGVAREAITVGSYGTKKCWDSQVGEQCVFLTIGDISSFSSKGPTRDGRQKPDVAAPGQVIVSTHSDDASLGPELHVPDGQHSILQGTSMASPHVAGAVALLLAENPTLDAAQIRAKLQGDATKDGFTGGSCNNTWGCGKLNIQAPVVMSLSKVANLSSVVVGDQFTYTLTATNDGSVLATGVTITDALPQSLNFVSSTCAYDLGTHTVNCSLGDVSGGASVGNTITVIPNVDGTITNDASVASGGTTLDTANVAITVNVIPPVVLSLEKEASSETVLVGELVTFNLHVGNEGTVSAPNVNITDVLPENLEFDSASPGCGFDSSSNTVTCALGDISVGAMASSTIAVLPSAPGTFNNDASVASDGVILDTASVSITASPAVTLTKVADLATVFVGEPVSFTFKALNVGASTSTAITITDVLPDNLEFSSASSGCDFDTGSRTVTCVVGDLGPGNMATSTIVALSSAPGPITNQAVVTSDNPVPGSTHGSATSEITAIPAVTLDKVASPTSVNVGEPVTFTFEVKNVGLSTSTAVTIIDGLHPSLSFVSASPGCEFDSAEHEVTCLLGELSIGAMASSTVVVIPTTFGTIDNEATVTTSNPIPGSMHSTASSSVTVSPANQPPIVNAGPDQIITLPASADLVGTATDDGLILSPLILTWSLVTGAGIVSFDDTDLGDTDVSFLTDGLYVLRLEAFDGELSAGDELTIDVRPATQQNTGSSGGGGGGGARITPVIAFRPEEPLVFTATEGEDNPEPQILRVWTSKNRSVLRFLVSSNVPWLKIDPTEGLSDDPGDKERITLSVVTSGLKAGAHEGKITISARKAKNDPQEVPVTLILEEPLPSEPSELAKVVEESSLDDAVDILEEISISDAVDVFEELDSRKAADILSELDGARAGIILGDLTVSKFATILGASDVNELEEALSEMSSESFIAASQQLGVRDTLLSKLPRVSAEQLFPERLPQADPTLPLPVALQESNAVISYDVARTSKTGWTTLVGSPTPIERVVAKFTESLEDIHVKVETLDQIPEGLPELSSGQVVNSLFSVDIDDANGEEITVAHVTLAIEKDWLEVNEIHKWSIKLNRFDEQLGKWVAFPTRRISEDADRILYTAAVPGFSVFAVTGSKDLFEPVLEVLDLRVIPTSSIEGQDVRIITAVRNIGVEDAVFPASLWVDDLLEDSETILVKAGESAEVTFKLGKRVGKHRIRVDRLLGEFEVRPSVRLLERPPIEFSTPAPSAATAPTPTATAKAVATPAPPTRIATVAPQPTATPLPTPQPTATAVASAAPALPRAPAPPSQPPVEAGAPSTIDDEGGIGTTTLIVLIIVGIVVLAGIAVVAQGLRFRRREA